MDRYYIEMFLASHASDVRGHVLEIGDNNYTKRFGGGHVTKSDVLSVSRRQDAATIIADLSAADEIPSDTFDCIILTQTLQLIYDIHAAVRTLHRILKPAGVLLVTVPGISKIARADHDEWYDQWRLTTRSCHTLFREIFSSEAMSVTSYGNVLTAISFLEGLAAEELQEHELMHGDPDYQVVLSIRAVKTPTST